jgi:hypothetical protein
MVAIAGTVPAEPAETPDPPRANPESTNALVTQFRAARRVSVPLVAVTTPDPAATIHLLSDALKDTVPRLVWDVVTGTRALNAAAAAARGKITGDKRDPTIGNAHELFKLATDLPPGAVLFVHMANRWIVSPPVIQALWSLRDHFKQNRRTVVLLGPGMDLPPELSGDVVVMDDPLPGPTALEEIIRSQFAAAELPAEDAQVAAAIEAVQGLPAFGAEQAVAMSLTADGLNIPALWERKRQQIELTPGLKVERSAVRFDDIGGVDTIKDYMRRIVRGNGRPGAVVFVDEVEKFVTGGSEGADTSGVSKDQLGTLLAYMQDSDATGALFLGPPGSAKSMVAKACGTEAGIPTISLDLGGLKGSLVGQSEQNLRAALKVITSVSNGQSLWVATSNNIAQLPPELRRRFDLGTWFFDLPTPAERERIWAIWIRRFALSDITASRRPEDDGWTGAEIRGCCRTAWRLGCTLLEAADFVVPVSISAADQLERLRTAAEGKYLSASNPGVYRHPGRFAADQPRGIRAASINDED